MDTLQRGGCRPSLTQPAGLGAARTSRPSARLPQPLFPSLPDPSQHLIYLICTAKVLPDLLPWRETYRSGGWGSTKPGGPPLRLPAIWECVFIYIHTYTYAGEVCTIVCASLCMSPAFTGRPYVPRTHFCGVHACVLWVFNCICAYTCTYMHVCISACMSSRTRQFREQFYFPYKQTLAWKCGP